MTNTTTPEIYPVHKTQSPKVKPDLRNPPFGKFFSDHMFVAKYSRQKGWYQAEICPYSNFSIDPAASALHYGQAIFEGLKAFKQSNGKCAVFRPEFNWARMKEGAERLCMEAPPKEVFVNGIKQLIGVERDWIPSQKGCSLYIRPTLIGIEAFLGVRPADEYLFFVILSPAGNYYSEGLKPLGIWVEDNYVRAAPGGLGFTKAAANYAGSLRAAYEAKKKGFAQVLWLDTTRKFIEEVGTMNIFFVFEGEVVTPKLDGTILSGGVRDCVMTLLKDWKLPVVERKITLQEVRDSASHGRLKEVFGTGTAAVVSPVGELAASDWKITLSQGAMGPLSQRLYDEITGIHSGERLDRWNWLSEI